MRKTKIVCTLGPASDSAEKIESLIKAGMNVARINVSHATLEHHEQVIERVKEVRERLSSPVAIMIDTKGPEIRIGIFENGSVLLENGKQFILTTRDIKGNKDEVSITFPGLIKDVKEGAKILINDGLVELRVKEVNKVDIICNIIQGGKLSDRKSLFVPDVKLSIPFLSEVDKKDLLFACRMQPEFIAASFVNRAEDIKEMRKFLIKNGGGDIEVIAKIESVEGVKNADEIIVESDGVMVARGDLGVEYSIEYLPAIQKSLIAKARKIGKRVITATEMLESMIEKPRPTRAECSDVANAVYDCTTAVMLSGETAIGVNPVNVVKMMSKICIATENVIDYENAFNKNESSLLNTTNAVSHAACRCAFDLKSPCIVAFTMGGCTARMVSKFRPVADILGITTSKRVFNKLAFSWGVIPEMCAELDSTDDMFDMANKIVVEKKFAKKGDLIVLCAGIPVKVTGKTNFLKVSEI